MSDSQECKTETRGRAAGLEVRGTEIVEQRMLVPNVNVTHRARPGGGAQDPARTVHHPARR